MDVETVAAPVRAKTEYVCPMHAQIVRDAPGACPICGMALEPRTIAAKETPNTELVAMRRRFFASIGPASVVFLIGMSDLLPGMRLHRVLGVRTIRWIEFGLATPVVLWGAWPFFVRGWQSLINRRLNMFTLFGLGIGVAYAYSVVGHPRSFHPPFEEWMVRSPFRGRCSHRRAGVARANPRARSTERDQRSDPCALAPGAEDRATS